MLEIKDHAHEGVVFYFFHVRLRTTDVSVSELASGVAGSVIVDVEAEGVSHV